MEKNVGLLDSYIRLSAGVFMVGWGVVRTSPVMIGLGAMKVAEGVTRWCPVLSAMGISTDKIDLDIKGFKGLKDFEFTKDEKETPDVQA